jgi:hypothetical protein
MPLAPHLPAAQADDHAALIVALDAGDLAGPDLARAEQLSASCDGCAALVADLALIRAAMDALPVPARRRDYQLSADDAARLRPSAWRRFLTWLSSPGSGVRPLATGLATLGVVGLLLTAGLPGFGFGFGSSGAAILSTVGSRVDASGVPGAPAGDDQGTYPPAAAPGAAPMPEPSAPANELGPAGVAGAASSAAPDEGRNATSGDAESAPGEKAAATDAGSSGPSAGVAISIALLVAGLGLFVARALARRRLT